VLITHFCFWSWGAITELRVANNSRLNSIGRLPSGGENFIVGCLILALNGCHRDSESDPEMAAPLPQKVVAPERKQTLHHCPEAPYPIRPLGTQHSVILAVLPHFGVLRPTFSDEVRDMVLS
jgi:hypothetical protein